MSQVYPIVVPKWGLEMEEGTLVAWRVAIGQRIEKGDELIDIETTKVTNTLESSYAGMLRRIVADVDKTYACGTLIGVIADAAVSEEELDRFVSGYAVIAKHKDTPLGSVPQTVEVNGKSIRYLRVGAEGVPVLFIHGLSGDLDNWQFLQPVLASDRATYAIDLPGHGGSTKDLRLIEGLADIADLLLAFLDIEQLPRVHVVAHSMGAAIAMDMARKRPDCVASLSLLSPAAMGAQVNQSFLDSLLAARTQRAVANVLKTLFVNESLVSREMSLGVLKYKRLDGVEAALHRYAQFLMNIDPSGIKDLPTIASPVQILWGTGDRIIPASSPLALPSTVRLIMIDGAGHMPHLEQSAQTAAFIQEFING
jgi:pyruvate dehydrogenase E2 component (dihydrolipoamide acetyltransferase)